MDRTTALKLAVRGPSNILGLGRGTRGSLGSVESCPGPLEDGRPPGTSASTEFSTAAAPFLIASVSSGASGGR
jgi:hypothetical protein